MHVSVQVPEHSVCYAKVNMKDSFCLTAANNNQFFCKHPTTGILIDSLKWLFVVVIL